MRTWITSIVCAASIGVLWLLWPARFDPAYWDEPEPPALEGVLEPRGRLAGIEEIGRGLITNSEDIAVAPDGSVWASQHDGSVVRLAQDGQDVWQVTEQVSVSRLPALGLQWDAQGRLIVAASDGMYAVTPGSTEVETLTTTAGDRPLGFADDLDIADDGMIYFSEASWKWANDPHLRTYAYDMAENRPYGALVALDPETGATEILVEDLYFANGVAMSADQQSVFVLETYRYRLSRYWLAGPRAGEFEVVADNLPGIPDGVLGDGEGHLYIAMDTQRVPLLRFLHRNPFLTRMITKFPDNVWIQAGAPRAFVLVLNEDGDYLDSFHDPDGRFGLLANAVPDDNGNLWLGSLTEGVIGRMPIPTQPDN
ncbi:MAG: SMP-30/gluconolactonase/LRE family protein [Maricaulis sp.]|uniref:SMP-30/gluconolactonase/LRE family protein n=1 Tax=Maricaulis sp. TaxID=1486257 RepID=UPI002630ACAC|nr:SMP-30/gluconolactonase/LRE family protein [Maricaulis sp.]MDM7984909.1 SMP-30/gluconolactonase/LRE family protein [Maricaulis sp.]